MNSPAPSPPPQPQAKPARRVTKIFVRYLTKGVVAGGRTVDPKLVSALQAEVAAQRGRMSALLIAGLVLIATGVIAPVIVPVWGLAAGAVAALLGVLMFMLRSGAARVLAQAQLAVKLAAEASGETFQNATAAMFDL